MRGISFVLRRIKVLIFTGTICLVTMKTGLSAMFVWVRLLIGAGLLVWLFYRFDFVAAWQAGREADVPMLVLASLLFVVPPILIQPLKFLWMVNRFHKHSLSLIIRLSLLGYFFNQFLPSSVGGDAVKVLWLSRKYGQWKVYMTAALLDRLSGAVVLFAGLAMYVAWFGLPEISVVVNSVYLWTAGVVLIILVVFAMIYRYGLSWKAGVVRNLQAIKPFLRAGNVWAILLLSMLAYAGYWLSTWVLLLGLGVAIPWWQAFFVLFASSFVASLPVSLGGIGLREGTMAGLLMLMGVPEAVAIHAAILQRLLIFVIALAGGVVYLGKGTYRVQKEEITHAADSFQ